MAKKAPLTKKKLQEFRDLLDQLKNNLIKEALESMGGMTESQESYADMADQASADLERDFDRRLKDRERRYLLKINETIQRIDNGTFGICEICGDQIGEERLRARPVTTQCIECKTDMEDQERRMEA